MSEIIHQALKSDIPDVSDTSDTSDTSDILDILDHWVVRYLRHSRKFQPLPATSRQTSHFRKFVKLLMQWWYTQGLHDSPTARSARPCPDETDGLESCPGMQIVCHAQHWRWLKNTWKHIRKPTLTCPGCSTVHGRARKAQGWSGCAGHAYMHAEWCRKLEKTCKHIRNISNVWFTYQMCRTAHGEPETRKPNGHIRHMHMHTEHCRWLEKAYTQFRMHQNTSEQLQKIKLTW